MDQRSELDSSILTTPVCLRPRENLRVSRSFFAFEFFIGVFSDGG